MLRHISPVVIQVKYSSSVESEELEETRKPKRSSRLRFTSPSPRTRNASTDGKRPHTVQRTHSYSELSVTTDSQASSGEHQNGTGGADMAAATVPSSSSSEQFLNVEEPRTRKSSGGSQTMFNTHFSLGLRFGGKGNKDKKKKKHSDALSPNAQTPSLSILTLYDIPPETLRLWKKSLDNVLVDPAGRELFKRHLNSEHSMENWQFCEDVDKFKALPDNKLAKEARALAATYIGDDTPMALNIDAKVVNSINAEMKQPHRDMFDKARDAAYDLMSKDTFRRFTMSSDFQKASTRDRHSPQPPP